MDNNKIVESIKNICKSHDITVTKLEETLGFSQGLISRWAKSDPSLSKIIDIADYFNVSLDKITGYRNVLNDKFIEKLIIQTIEKKITWEYYSYDQQTPKRYIRELYDEDTFNDISYFSCINSSYVIINGFYHYNHLLKPNNIVLLIQPNANSELVFQDYSYNDLKSLWLNVLDSFGDSSPDEIKAERFKHSFIYEDK